MPVEGAAEEVFRLSQEWRARVNGSLDRIEKKLDHFDERLRVVEISVVQKRQIDDLIKRVSDLENFKARAIGYALALGSVMGLIFEGIRTFWHKP